MQQIVKQIILMAINGPVSSEKHIEESDNSGLYFGGLYYMHLEIQLPSPISCLSNTFTV